MKKRLAFITSLVVLVAILCSCGGENVLSVKQNQIRMKKDETYTIRVNQTKEEELEWESANPAVVTVDQDGTVTSVGAGVTTVSALGEKAYIHIGVIVEGTGDYIDKDGNYIPAPQPSDITEIVVGVHKGGKKDITIKKDDVYQLVAYKTPSDSKDPIRWEVDKKDIVRVDKDGKLTAIGKGTAIVTAYAPNNVKGELIVRCK